MGARIRLDSERKGDCMTLDKQTHVCTPYEIKYEARTQALSILSARGSSATDRPSIRQKAKRYRSERQHAVLNTRTLTIGCLPIAGFVANDLQHFRTTSKPLLPRTHEIICPLLRHT